MQVGTTQSYSLINAVSVSPNIEQMKAASDEDGTVDAVQLSVGDEVDKGYVQRVLETELGQSFANALRDAGIEGQALDDILSGAVDTSPKATADRIVSFATSFLGAFQANNADQQGLAQIDGFTDLIHKAVEEGFTQAKDILEGITKISGGVAADIEETFALVVRGINDFAEGKRGLFAEAEEAPTEQPSELTEDLVSI